jgi:hypothetical protein
MSKSVVSMYERFAKLSQTHGGDWTACYDDHNVPAAWRFLAKPLACADVQSQWIKTVVKNVNDAMATKLAKDPAFAGEADAAQVAKVNIRVLAAI